MDSNEFGGSTPDMLLRAATSSNAALGIQIIGRALDR
jgi:hypothetical protein